VLHQNGRRLAGFWIRLAADFIDGVIAVAFALPVWLLVDRPLLDSRRFDDPGFATLVLLLFFLYNMTYRVSRTGQSLGRKMARIEVLDARTGRTVGFLRCLLRNLFAGFISCIFYAGFLWMLVDRNKQTWHDKVFGTSVTYEPGA